MNTQDLEILSGRLANADLSAQIDVDPNWFNGSCIKTKDKDPIYLVMNGEKRQIPDPPTYYNLFKDPTQIRDIDDLGPVWDKIVDIIPTGDPITNGALLIKADNSDPIYLLTNNKKYLISSPKQFYDCNFKADNVKKYPSIVVDAIPTGENNMFQPTEMKK